MVLERCFDQVLVNLEPHFNLGWLKCQESDESLSIEIVVWHYHVYQWTEKLKRTLVGIILMGVNNISKSAPSEGARSCVIKLSNLGRRVTGFSADVCDSLLKRGSKLSTMVSSEAVDKCERWFNPLRRLRRFSAESMSPMVDSLRNLSPE